MNDHDAALRRVERHSDLSRTAFVVFGLSLAIVAAFGAFMFYLERAGG